MYLYRRFLLTELPAIQFTHNYVKGRLTTRTKLLFGRDDVNLDYVIVDADHSKFADDLVIEFVEDCAHFIVDEQPELVTERLLEWFAD
jgi:pimeloyl-ACP methyl ester carboxylesterase